MNTHSFKETDIFLRLRSPSFSVAYEALLEIRSKILPMKDGINLLSNNGSLKDLVNFLQKPNEKILDVTLSILGNCCLKDGCRKKVVAHGIIKPIVSILMNINKDSIQCRVCRLIGNLAQDGSIAEELLKEKIVISVVSMLDLDSNYSTATRQMAVRALRMLWAVEDQRSDMLQYKVVRAVSLLLSGNAKSREDQNLLYATVKALTVFTHHCSDECAQQVEGNGSSFEHLISLVSNSKLKEPVIIIICNLCQASNSRPSLGNAGAVEIIIKELSNPKQDKLELYAALVMAFCYLCRESVNRAKIRRAGGLHLMLQICRNTSLSRYQPHILHALTMFMYDDTGIQELLKEGLVRILVEKIVTFVKDHGRLHIQSNKPPEDTGDSKDNTIVNKELKDTLRQSCHNSRSRNNSISTEKEVLRRSPTCDDHCGEDSPTMKNLSPDHYNFGDWSPGSPSSMCFSPDACSPPQKGFWPNTSPQVSSGYSPESSPNSRIADDFDCPEVYSPVCCDPGDDETEDADDHDVYDLVGGGGDEDDVSILTKPPEDNEMQSSITDYRQKECSVNGELDPALILLSRISHMDNPVEDLASEMTLTALLDYITLIRFPQPRAQRILFRIIRNHHYFMSLLLQRFVLTVQSRLCQEQHYSCWMCDEFKVIGSSLLNDITKLAHSGFGEGELAYQLLKAEDSVQRLLVVSIPFIVRIHRILWKLLMECKGLEKLINILNSEDRQDDLIDYVPISLKLLVASLDIYAANDEVFLQLDDGQTVQVSKNYLSSQSPVFEAMFNGGFKESKEEYIALPGVSHDCLNCLFRVINIGHVPKVFPGIDLNTSLELTAVLDRFLIPGSEHVMKMILEKFLSSSTAAHIYGKCIEAGDISYFNILRQRTAKFFLTSDVTHKKTRKMFKDILCTPYKNQLLIDVTDVLEEKLRNSYNKSTVLVSP
ncbi:hypothetical protein C0J52_14981 [Blattella germanica]|nr:hypothetical protein C0J52_14981 [Blattella germanica]